MLHEVPTLTDLLPADARKALSAASRGFCERFTARVKVVTVRCKQDLPLTNECRCPLVSMVILPTFAYWDASPILLQRLEAHIYLSLEGNKSHAFISLLRPLHTPAWSMAWVSTAAQQMENQIAAKWPKLSKFDMGHVRLGAVGTAIIAQLTKGKWPSLRYLGLSNCQLGAQGVLPLSQGKWPGLWVLKLSCNCLDAEGMALLAKGNWPLLQTFHLYENPSLDALAIAHLSAITWPLQTLILQRMPFTSAWLPN